MKGKSASNGCLIFTVRLARSTREISMNGLTEYISRGKWWHLATDTHSTAAQSADTIDC